MPPSLSGGTGQWLRVLSVTGSSISSMNAVFPFGTGAVRAGVQAGMQAASQDEGFSLPGGPCLCCGPRLNTPLCSRVTG